MNNYHISLARVANVFFTILFACSALPLQAQVADLSEIGNDPRRALVVRVFFRKDGTAEFDEAFVTDVPPGTHIADPPQILLEYFDVNGNLVDMRNAWDPRWEFQETEEGGERQVDLLEAVGAFGILFSPDIATVRISDQHDDPATLLIEIDVQTTVMQFCVDNPDDPNCEDVSPDDADNDGIPDQDDNCPNMSNPDQDDLDNDGEGDACDFDDDGDSVLDTADVCPQTVFPETVLSTDSLKPNRWALSQDGNQFFQAPPQSGSKFQFSTTDTGGCSCAQIVSNLGVGGGHLRYGCSNSVMLKWESGG